MTYTVAVSSVPMKLGETDRTRSILMNIATILRTRKGSVPMYRQFGLSQDYVGMPTIAARPVMYAAIREAVEAFEPRCRVIGVTFSESSPGELIPSVEVEINE